MVKRKEGEFVEDVEVDYAVEVVNDLPSGEQESKDLKKDNIKKKKKDKTNKSTKQDNVASAPKKQKKTTNDLVTLPEAAKQIAKTKVSGKNLRELPLDEQIEYFNTQFFAHKKFADIERNEKTFTPENFIGIYKKEHTLDNFPDYIKFVFKHWESRFRANSSTPKSRPICIIVCSSAIQAADVFKSLRRLGIQITKLFAKHIKIEEQIELLKQYPIRLAVGTPNRLTKLLDENVLSLQDVEALVIDCSKDKKEMTVFDLQDLRRDFFDFLDRYGLPVIRQGKCRLGLY